MDVSIDPGVEGQEDGEPDIFGSKGKIAMSVGGGDYGGDEASLSAVSWLLIVCLVR